MEIDDSKYLEEPADNKVLIYYCEECEEKIVEGDTYYDFIESADFVICENCINNFKKIAEVWGN